MRVGVWLLIAAVGIGGWGLAQTCAPPPPSPRVVDSLQAHSARLDSVNEALREEAQGLAAERDSILHARDSLKQASARRTQALRTERAQLPDITTVPDSALRDVATHTQHLLDSALVELTRKDDIIRADSVAWAKDQQQDLRLLARIDTITVQRDDARQIAATWEKLYRKETHKRCGRTCGAVIGAVLALTGTIVVKKAAQ